MTSINPTMKRKVSLCQVAATLRKKEGEAAVSFLSDLSFSFFIVFSIIVFLYGFSFFGSTKIRKNRRRDKRKIKFSGPLFRSTSINIINALIINLLQQRF